MRTMWIFVVAAALANATPAPAANLANGEKKVQICLLCHKAGGHAPRLEGRPAHELAVAIEDFRSGRRFEYAMDLHVKRLTPKDVRDVAAYLASLPEPERLPDIMSAR